MLNTGNFGNRLKEHGFSFFSGVPCSFLKPLINYSINECDYVMAANEGDAVAHCAGAYLGGKKSVFLCQNSGLTNATSPLASLNFPFRIPVLGFVSLRGDPGILDEPQHDLMGTITSQLLTLLNIEWEVLSSNLSEATQQIERASKIIDASKSFFFIVKKGTFSEMRLENHKSVTVKNESAIHDKGHSELPSRRTVLDRIVQSNRERAVIIATTGFTGRELCEVEDAHNHFYMVGSMGCASAIGLGLAISRPKNKVIVLDGDGAALMRMGSFATVSNYQPQNLVHRLLDNNCHDSTGGQLTVSHNIDFVGVTASLGYSRTYFANSLEQLTHYFTDWVASPHLTFVHMRISKETSADLSRPQIKPEQVKERLMAFLGSQR